MLVRFTSEDCAELQAKRSARAAAVGAAHDGETEMPESDVTASAGVSAEGSADRVRGTKDAVLVLASDPTNHWLNSAVGDSPDSLRAAEAAAAGRVGVAGASDSEAVTQAAGAGQGKMGGLGAWAVGDIARDADMMSAAAAAAFASVGLGVASAAGSRKATGAAPVPPGPPPRGGEPQQGPSAEGPKEPEIVWVGGRLLAIDSNSSRLRVLLDTSEARRDVPCCCCCCCGLAIPCVLRLVRDLGTHPMSLSTESRNNR